MEQLKKKNDVNNILSNCDEALELVNGLNHKLNPKYEKRDFYADLNRMLFKLLTKNPEYENKRTKNRHIEVRGWLTPFTPKLYLRKTIKMD